MLVESPTLNQWPRWSFYSKTNPARVPPLLILWTHNHFGVQFCFNLLKIMIIAKTKVCPFVVWTGARLGLCIHVVKFWWIAVGVGSIAVLCKVFILSPPLSQVDFGLPINKLDVQVRHFLPVLELWNGMHNGVAMGSNIDTFDGCLW